MISRTSWYGDHRMLEFLAQWGFILDHLEGDTAATLHANGDRTLRDLLFRQVEKSASLAEDVAHYKRVGKQHEYCRVHLPIVRPSYGVRE